MFFSAAQRKRARKGERSRSSSFEEVVYVNSRFTENRAEGALRHIATVVRKRDFSSGLHLAPDLVATGTGTVELETKRFEAAGNIPVGNPERRPI
jgi:hypothetical protein